MDASQEILDRWLGVLPHDKNLTDASALDLQIERSPIKNGFYRGRRRRTFARSITYRDGPKLALAGGSEFRPDPGVLLSYNGVYEWLCQLHPGAFALVLTMALPIGEEPANGYEDAEGYHTGSNSANLALTVPLQDLSEEIQTDIHDALGVLDDQNLWYPGIDPPLIVPLPDDHVGVVMKAMQRELDREPRDANGGRRYWPETANLPIPQLAELPWRIQRALAERRRYRFSQFGITPESWKSGVFSLWDIPEDPEWLPRVMLNNDGITPTDEPRVMPDRPDPIIQWAYEGVDDVIRKEVWNLYVDGEYIRTEHRPPLWD